MKTASDDMKREDMTSINYSESSYIVTDTESDTPIIKHGLNELEDMLTSYVWNRAYSDNNADPRIWLWNNGTVAPITMHCVTPTLDYNEDHYADSAYELRTSDGQVIRLFVVRLDGRA